MRNRGKLYTPPPPSDKTIEQIRLESEHVDHMLRQLAQGPEATPDILAYGLSMIYERLGDYWAWQKAHRGS